jgi:pyrroloquinoline quinone biosynthesis protein D
LGARAVSVELDPAARPRLARGVRLHEDRTRGGFVLLAPERVLTANAAAVEILKRCDGERTLSAIVDDLVQIFPADRARIAADVEALLADLEGKRMIEL